MIQFKKKFTILEKFGFEYVDANENSIFEHWEKPINEFTKILLYDDRSVGVLYNNCNRLYYTDDKTLEVSEIQELIKMGVFEVEETIFDALFPSCAFNQ